MSTRPATASAPGLDGALVALVARWQGEATNLRGWGAHAQADAVARCAAQLEAVCADEDGVRPAAHTPRHSPSSDPFVNGNESHA